MLILTERIEHLDAIQAALNGKVPPPFVLCERISKKQRVTDNGNQRTATRVTADFSGDG